MIPLGRCPIPFCRYSADLQTGAEATSASRRKIDPISGFIMAGRLADSFAGKRINREMDSVNLSVLPGYLSFVPV